MRMFWDGRVKAFHTDRYEAGHRATDYKKWLQATRPYNIVYEEGFEPYVIISRKFVPWYDERFVGYRKNKVVHLLYLSTSGIQFMVHPRAFTVHSPHPRARTWKVTHKTGLWDQARSRRRRASALPWRSPRAAIRAVERFAASCLAMLASRKSPCWHHLACHSACSWPRFTTKPRWACLLEPTLPWQCTRAVAIRRARSYHSAPLLPPPSPELCGGAPVVDALHLFVR